MSKNLTGIRVGIMAALAVVAVGTLAIAANPADIAPRPTEFENLTAIQCLTYIVIAMIGLAGFLSWMGFRRLAGIEAAIREHISKLDARKCLLNDADYMRELRRPTP